MAYITKEETKEIRNNLKKAFPDFKFSVRNENSSRIYVSIMESPLDFTWKQTNLHNKIEERKDHYNVNHYHIDNSNYPHADVLKKISAIIHAKHWDKSDIQSDYFNCAFYVSINVGKWDKPYQQKVK